MFHTKIYSLKKKKKNTPLHQQVSDCVPEFEALIISIKFLTIFFVICTNFYDSLIKYTFNGVSRHNLR